MSNLVVVDLAAPSKHPLPEGRRIEGNGPEVILELLLNVLAEGDVLVSSSVRALLLGEMAARIAGLTDVRLRSVLGAARVDTLWVEGTGLGYPLLAQTLCLDGLARSAPGMSASGEPSLGGRFASARALFDTAEATRSATRIVDAAGEAVADGAWGAGLTASGELPEHGRVCEPASDGGFMLVEVEPSRGGGLLGLLEGARGLMSGATSRELSSCAISGAQALSVDGWPLSAAGSWSVRRGPSVTISR